MVHIISLVLNVDRELTPGKDANKASQYSQIWNCSFGVKYGTGRSSRVSTEYLFEVSNHDGSRGELIAAMYVSGIQIVKSSGLSSKIFNLCAPKVRSLSRFLTR